MLRNHVAVIGAGIIGLLTALELRRRGHRVSIHSTGIAEGATYAAAGMLAPAAEIQHGQSGLWPLMREAAALHDRLAADLAARTDLPTGYRDDSTLVVGRDHADLRTLHDLAGIQRATGAEVEELLPAQARGHEPALARALAGGILIDRDRQVDPRVLAAAVVDLLGRPESDQGPPVPIHEGTIASTEEIDADHIVLSAGLGVTAIDGGHRRLDLALRPVRGDILRVRAPRSLLAPGEEGLLSRTVRAIVRGRPLYLVPRAGAQLVLGATSREDDLAGPSTGGVLQLLQDAAEILPSVRETELLEVIARDRPGTPDDLPLLGPVPGEERLIVSTGYHRHGILLAPWAAARTADLIEDPSLATGDDFAAVRPDRFTADATRTSTESTGTTPTSTESTGTTGARPAATRCAAPSAHTPV